MMETDLFVAVGLILLAFGVVYGAADISRRVTPSIDDCYEACDGVVVSYAFGACECFTTGE